MNNKTSPLSFSNSYEKSTAEARAIAGKRLNEAYSLTLKTRALIYSQYTDIDEPELAPVYAPELNSSVSVDPARASVVASQMVNEKVRQDDWDRTADDRDRTAKEIMIMSAHDAIETAHLTQDLK